MHTIEKAHPDGYILAYGTSVKTAAGVSDRSLTTANITATYCVDSHYLWGDALIDTPTQVTFVLQNIVGDLLRASKTEGATWLGQRRAERRI